MAIPIAAGAIRAASKILSVNKLFKRNVETAVESNAEVTKKSLKTISATNKQVRLEEKKQKQLEKKIREEVRNEAAESKLETRKGLPTMKGLINNVIKKPLNALLNLLAAWAVSNLPWIIKQLKIIVKKVNIFKKSFGVAMNGVGKSLRGLYKIVIAALQNLKEFDFSDRKNRIKDAVDEFNVDREEMITGFTEMKDVWGRDEEELDVILKSMREGETLEKALRAVDAEFVNNTTALTPVTGKDAGGKADNSSLPYGVPQTTGGNSDFWTLVAIASREDSDAQGRADVAQSIYNRAMVGRSGGFYDGISGNILGRMQYEPTWQYPNGAKNGKGNPNDEWKNITDAASAAKASGMSVGQMQTVANQLRDPKNQKNAAEFVQGSTDFRGYKVNGGKQRKAGDNYFGHFNNYTANKVAPVPSMGSPSTSTQTQTEQPAKKSAQQSAGNIASGMQPPVATTLASDNKGMTLGNNTLRSSDFNTTDRSVPSPIIKTSPRGMRNGKHHGGIDFAPPQGDKRWFCGFLSNAKVSYVGWLSGYGNTVILEAMGKDFLFAHLSEYSPGIRSGAPYKSGQPIGRVGSTGRSDSEHLHFEVRKIGGGYGSDIPAEKYVKYVVFGMLKKESRTLTASGKGGANADELARVASSRRTGAGSNQGGSTTILTINQPYLVG
jgi:murein DD-endopeptidase MepM/ murein hydrolase activator NlpD